MKQNKTTHTHTHTHITTVINKTHIHTLKANQTVTATKLFLNQNTKGSNVPLF